MSTAPASLSPLAADPWWRGAVIYHIYPRSFADSNGDGIGDLAGITAHLEYVASLGVDAIWLSPFFTSPMKDFGYDISNYCDVDPIFGTLADFDRLLARAHELGLRVIIDQVLSHTSDQHPWFRESRISCDNPRGDWYVWADARPDGGLGSSATIASRKGARRSGGWGIDEPHHRAAGGDADIDPKLGQCARVVFSWSWSRWVERAIQRSLRAENEADTARNVARKLAGLSPVLCGRRSGDHRC